MSAWLIAKFWPWILALVAIPAIYWRGKHNGRAAEGRETLQRYARERQAIDAADLGIGASDDDRIKRLREFADKP